MDPVFRKLTLKGQPLLYILDAPESFSSAVASLTGLAELRTSLARAKDLSWVLQFALTRKQVDAFATRIAKAATGDATVWVAYPKGTSRKYKADFNRDHGWEKMGEAGFEPVSQVSIDEDWSALRFRRVEHIKVMTRAFAMTAAGKRKTGRA